MDFTLKTYRQLLTALHNQGFVFQTFQEYIESYKGLASPCLAGSHADRHGRQALGDLGARVRKEKEQIIILRHDVDKLPENSLHFARIQHQLGIKGSYYFRAVPESLPAGQAGWDEQVIKEIADLGHEIGYHYECITTTNGDIEKGIKDFEKNLIALRKLAPVKTICMHGSPKSKWDSKDLWKHYNYHNYGIIGEPYFDINFDEMFYLTDTGRRWDGWKVSLRDKVPQQERWKKQGLSFHSTHEIIKAAEHGHLPSKIMMTFHPQRWTNDPVSWTKELVWQNVKNMVKFFLNKT